jgi:acetyl-CoA carboxylase biotin carboxyl carrier protein
VPVDRESKAGAEAPAGAARQPRATTKDAVGSSTDTAAGRVRRDHAAIARLADDLLPALIAKLGATGLGEIEVRQGEWRARLRKPVAGGGSNSISPAAAGAAQAGGTHALISGSSRLDRGAVEQDLAAGESAPQAEPQRAVATSPAVGIYHPCKDLMVGMKIRAGDRLGSIDVLGVHQDVMAPVGGVVGAALAEAGEAVEYGQELIRIEPSPGGLDLDASPGYPDAEGVMGEI